MTTSAYIHIPFCKSICSYCDFCKMLYVNNWVNDYLKALYKEIKDSYQGEKLKTIYIGGGTPSSLKPNQLEVLFKIIELLNKDDDCEFTFECNIDDINVQLLNILYKNKVNRLSIGIESFDKENLKYLNRTTDFKDALNKIEMCRKYKFDNINIDLMYAIPNESLKTLKKDLGLILKLKPDHISTYSLIVEYHTKVGIENPPSFDENIELSMYEHIEDTLEAKGYTHYEVSNFAKKGKESNHNLTYWNNEEYYGFGLGASGFVDNVRYDNTRNLKKYLNKEYRANAEILVDKTNMDNEIMLGLRKLEGINIEHFQEKFGKDIFEIYPVIKDLIKSKELKLKKNMLFINEEDIYVMNEILIKIV